MDETVEFNQIEQNEGTIEVSPDNSKWKEEHIKIVYCKECKYRYEQEVCLTSLPPQFITLYWCNYYNTIHPVKGTDFCSKGDYDSNNVTSDLPQINFIEKTMKGLVNEDEKKI